MTPKRQNRTNIAALVCLVIVAMAAALFSDAFSRSDPAGEPAATAELHTPQPELTAEGRALLDAQLGLLSGQLTTGEYERCAALMAQLYPLRQGRLEDDEYGYSDREQQLLTALNRLYERYSVKYLGEGSYWPYTSPPEQVLAEFRVNADGELTLRRGSLRETNGWTEADYAALWDQVTGILPDGAWAEFSRFTVVTDGPDELLAYVVPADEQGGAWELAIDPADVEDEDFFLETVLHEYTHYLTLNHDQASYGVPQTASTYNEPGMVSHPDSYLNAFYQAFWQDYLDDRLINPDSDAFYLRHEDDFVTYYAATDPSEDIAECFTFFVLWDDWDSGTVWGQKLEFFYGYPELVDLRTQVRARLALE